MARIRFIAQTFALEVDHGDFLARYGEIQAKTTVKQGDKVRAGQQIAMVGHLVGIQVPSDMLHLELYDKSASGPLTITDTARSKKRSDGIPFMRRKDLIDPTASLNKWRVSSRKLRSESFSSIALPALSRFRLPRPGCCPLVNYPG